MLATIDFQRFGKPDRRDKFLTERSQVVPSAELLALIGTYYG